MIKTESVEALVLSRDTAIKALEVAKQTLCEYESREIDSGNLRGGIAATALTEISNIIMDAEAAEDPERVANLEFVVRQTKELLAAIHGDGGHHTDDVGLTQSIEDAIAIHYQRSLRISDLESDNASMLRLVTDIRFAIGDDGKRMQDELVDYIRLIKDRNEGHVQEIDIKNREIDELRAKKFTRFHDDECWIYQGDGSDNLESLVCPVVISAPELIKLIERAKLQEPDYGDMVNRFLAWKIPERFFPDNSISFSPRSYQTFDSPHWPTGTNLLDAEQAKEMFRHCVVAAPQDISDAEKWRAYQKRKSDMINGGLLKSPLRTPSNAELRAELDAMPTRPIDVMTERAITSLASQFDEEYYKAICHYLGVNVELGFLMDAIKGRAKTVCRPDKIMVFYMDSTPLLEILPLKAIWQGNKIIFTSNFKRLYGKENS